MGKLIKNHWARLIILTAAAYQTAASISAFFWPKLFWDFLTTNLDPAVRPVPILQIINLLLGLLGLCWEWPLPLFTTAATSTRIYNNHHQTSNHPNHLTLTTATTTTTAAPIPTAYNHATQTLHNTQPHPYPYPSYPYNKPHPPTSSNHSSAQPPPPPPALLPPTLLTKTLAAMHRSIEARLLIYPLSTLASLLLYQGTNAGLYYLVGMGVYFWGFSEGEVVMGVPWTLPRRRLRRMNGGGGGMARV